MPCANISPPSRAAGLQRPAAHLFMALIISDVTGDDPTHIASGPCAPDPTTYSDALAIIGRYDIDAPAAVMTTLQAGARGERDETPNQAISF